MKKERRRKKKRRRRRKKKLDQSLLQAFLNFRNKYGPNIGKYF